MTSVITYWEVDFSSFKANISSICLP